MLHILELDTCPLIILLRVISCSTTWTVGHLDYSKNKVGPRLTKVGLASAVASHLFLKLN
jgi:hypothetical protein